MFTEWCFEAGRQRWPEWLYGGNLAPTSKALCGRRPHWPILHNSNDVTIALTLTIENMLHVDIILFYTETIFHCWSYDCVAEDLTSAYLQRGLACPRLWATISLLPARGATWNMRQNCPKHGNVSTNYAAKDMIFWLTTAISSKLGNMTT